MKRLFEYCYYRMAEFYEYYRDLGESHTRGSIALFFCISWNFLSILNVLFAIFDIKISIPLSVGICGFFILLSFFYDSKKRFLRLRERYKDEDRKALKGWLVFSYFIGSIALFLVSVAIAVKS